MNTLQLRRYAPLGAALALAVWAEPAAAAGPPPRPVPGAAAVDQYREAIPTGGGPVAPGAAKNTRKPLPAAAKRRLYSQGGSDATKLERIATSSAYGAPQLRLKVSKTRDEHPQGPLGTAISAVGSDVDSGGRGRLLVLFAAMLAIAGSAVLATVRQKRSRV